MRAYNFSYKNMKLKLKLFIIGLFCSVYGWGQATLPVTRTVWNSTPTGWTDTPLDSYLTTFACSGSNGAKFDTSGDLKIVNIDSAPNQLSFVVKSNAATTSSLLVQESPDGVSYTTVINLSGSADLPTSCTTKGPYTLLSGTRYIRWTFTKGTSNLTMDDVSITGTACTPPANPTGSISAAANPACSSTTLTYSAPAADVYWQTTASGTSTANPTTTALTASTTGVYYARRYNSATTCWSTSSVASATITINTNVAIGTQPLNRIITDGSNTTFTVAATGSTLTYQWQVDTGSGFVNLSNGAPYTTVTTPTLNITGATIGMNGYLYRCIVSGAAPCTSVTSNAGSLTVNYTAPNNPTAIVPCYGNNTLGLSWTASSGGSAPDEYMVFALAGTTAPAATSAVAGNASLYTANADFSLASVVTASLGKCLYKGTGTSFTVSGLTNLSNYSFKVVAYRGTTGTAWSSGVNTTGTWSTPATNITIDMPEVSALAASIASGQSALTWTRPTPLACYDEYLVVANQGAVVFTPAGDGTAYTANSVYAGANQVVYKGTGTGTTVTGLTNGTNYCYKVFVRRGTIWSDGVSICQTPNIVYCASGATNSGDSEIENVTLVGESNTISNNTTNACTTGVNNYTAMSADLEVGGTYTLTVTFGDCDGGTQYDGAGGVWIDWNNDGDFDDANETIGTALVAVSGGNVIQNFTINVPGGQSLGNFRMRIVQLESGTLGTISSCGTFGYGSTEDYTIEVVSSCVPTHSVTSFTPTSGPVGTEVTINGTGLTGATVTFSGINATIVSSSATKLVVVIPVGATTGNLSVIDAQPCDINNAFTILSSVNSACDGATTTDLIIYELHDEQTGDGGFISLYNGTAATVNLADYRLVRSTTYGGALTNYTSTFSGTIAPGQLGIVFVDNASCSYPTSEVGDLTAGFNENDQIQLQTSGGATIDDVMTPATVGYYMVRNTGALSARAVYVAADWSTTPLIAGQCIPSAGTIPPTGGSVPSITVQPTIASTCASTTASMSVSATEGFVGGNSLAYQWYVVPASATTWTALTNTGVYSGVTTATLSISSLTGLDGYQYYCQVRENTSTCYVATVAVKVSIGTTTWNGSAWSNGTPSLSKAAIIDGTYVTATNGNFSCCSLTVNATRSLTISSGGHVEVQNDIANSGTLTVLNSGSLVQINDFAVNTGNISYQRSTTGVPLDYVYWSSPVEVINTPSGYIYTWSTDIANTNGGQGNWSAAGNTPMQAGVGYIMRGILSRNFIGVPRNGVYTPTIKRGSDLGAGTPGPNGVMRLATDDNWNLLGNPYPSAISIGAFLTANPELDGFVRLWTHGTLPSSLISDPFYGNFVSNYTAADYIAINGSGATSGAGTLSVIGGGQSFFVLMNPGAAATSSALFNNSMRNTAYSNSQFYRNSNSITSNSLGENLERHRIWLDLITPNETTRTLVAYVEGATKDKDRMFDAATNYKMTQNFYSLIENDIMTIQGRALPFDANDKVPMGFKTSVSGNFTIALAEVDGVFDANQNIYLEDKELGIIHDLKLNPYSFTATSGINNTRFVLRYKNETLGSDDFTNTDDVLVSSSNVIAIASPNQMIKSVQIHNVLGQLLVNETGISASTFEINSIQKNSVPLIIQITLENGVKVTKKIVF
jgi:hypothetical protein